MKTTKRLFAMLLAVLMLLTLFPASALATEAEATEAYTVAPEVYTETIAPAYIAPEAHSIPAGWAPPSPPPLQKTISHWWPFLDINIDFNLWNIIGGNFPISVTLECNMFLALTQLYAMALITPGGGAGMTLNLTHDIVMPAMAPPAAVPAGATLYIRSSEPGVQRTITNLAFTEHFIVGPGATLVLEDVILCGGPESVFPGGSLMGAHHGGVRVEGRCLLLLQPVGGHLVMHRGSAIRNSNAVGNPIFRSRGGGVYLNSGSNTLFLPRSGGQLTMLPGSRIHNNVAARGGGVYASTNSIIRMAEGSRIDNNRAQSVGNIVNAYNTGTGGGIHLSSNAVLDMRGGSIDNNQAVYGGGVRLRGSNVANRAELHMTGGEIHNNRAIGSHSILTHPAMGGGIRACANSDITMTGGRIHSNTSANGGGGVSLGYKSLSTPGLISLGNRGARLNMTGGTIDNNRATTGGGVRVSAGALLSICNIRSPILELHGGTIANNRAQEGGGIWLQRNTRLCVDSRGGGGGRLLGWLFGSGSNASVPVIEGNHAYRRGGGIFAGAFTDAYLRAGTFRNNHAAQDGGAVFAQRFTYFTPVLTPGMYCDLKQVQSPTRFEGNTAGRGAFRPPVLNLRSLCLLFPFRSSATASPTFPPFMITAPNTLNNFDINFLGIPLAGGQTPTMATAYFMYNYDNVERESNIFDQDVVTIPPGTLEAPIEEPTRQGYQFLGWSLTEDGPTLVEFPTEVTTAMLCSRTVTTENNQTFTYQYLNLYAQWEPAYRWYRLSFIGNGGSPAYEVVWVNQYTTYEGAIAQWQYQTELEVPVREGYEFIAWALEEAPGEFALIGSHMYDFNVVENAEHHRWALFAQWRPIDPPPEPIQALFIGNGGSPGEILVYCYEEQVTYGCLIALWQYQTGLFEPTKVGYEFVGWSRSSVDEFPIVFPGSSVSGNILLFAQWRALTPPMMVTFIGNGGEPATITVFGDEIGTYGAAFQLWRDETGLQEPFKPGYAFQGWFHAPAGGEPVNLNSVLNNNQRAHTLYAQWEAIPVTAVEVVFLGNGGTPVLKTIVIDQEPTTYATAIEQWQYWAGKYVPTKEGHTFLGWARVTETGYEMVANTSALITGQNILAAQWERDAYITVTFNVTGGVPSLDPIVINHLPTTYGVAIEHWQYWARQDAPTRAGYTFQGWFHQPTGGTAVVPGSTLNRSITLYAQWERIPSIAVTFLGNGGLPVIETVVMNNTAATTYGAVITQWQYQTGLQAPTKEGHDFLGWARLTAAGPQLVVPGSALTEGTILVAQWRAVDAPITITFLGNGGRPIFEQVTIDLNVNQNPTYADAIFAWEQQTRLIAPTRQGHEFLHWSLTEDGGPVVGTLPVDAVGHAVLFAQWREVPGGIQEPVLMSFIGNGGTPAYRQVEINENTTFAAAISLWQAQNNQLEPSRPDFTFTHWSLYEEGPPISGSIRVMAAERFALFAQWAPVGGGDCTCDTPGCDCGVNCDCDANCDCASTEINVTFVGNEGIPGFTVVTIPVGAMYGLAITEWQAQTHLNVPTRAGHTFLGWSRVSAPGGALVTNTSTINANIILFAQWEEDEAEQITVTFHGNGGAPVREEVIVAEGATYGTAIAEWQYQTSLTVPTKTGYTFLHWSLDAAEGGVPVTDASTISRETNLYAQWEEDEAEQITVTFHGNGGAPVREEVTVAEGATYGTAIAEWQYQTSLTVPTKTGYTFLHWSLDAAEGGAPVT
ncbi:MAG: InlB B-repeat-containing protein, partial [Oscillospiraceae bacterium]|nr:InlB B-repeat-containing protein [Oscillospiraceae bacterium]